MSISHYLYEFIIILQQIQYSHETDLAHKLNFFLRIELSNVAVAIHKSIYRKKFFMSKCILRYHFMNINVKILRIYAM